MKFHFVLGTFAIATLMNACAGHDAGDEGLFRNDGDEDEGQLNVAGSVSEGQHDSGSSKNDDKVDDSKSDNAKSDDAKTEHDDSDDAGKSDDGDSDPPASNSAGSGGSGGTMNSGSNAGSGGTNSNGGSVAAAGSGGSAGSAAAGSGGSGGSVAAGSGGSAGSAGSAAAGNGGSAGSASAGGSAGSAGSAEAGGSAGSVSAGGAAGSVAVGGSGGSSDAAGGGGAGGSAGGGTDHSLDAEYLFTKETFGGNGRTCTTCHTHDTGTVNPEQVRALYASAPSDPLFRAIDSDDGVGSDYSQLRERATFRVTINLPSGVHLKSDASATSLTIRRGVPTTINTPALDSVIMWDGREPDISSQARDAIAGHAQGTVVPTDAQLLLITQFEQGPDFFSNDLLRQYHQGGATPTWPAGGTEAEQRGRRWFAQDAAAPRFNICGQCHGGPMLNETQANSGLGAGNHFQTVNVSEFNTLGHPKYEFTFPSAKAGQTVTVTTPDPGRALITGNVRDLNFFKIPTLWGVKSTAPYFHDNSALTLEELVDHYERHLATFLPRGRDYPSPHVPTAQDKADIVAYLKLL